MSDAIPCECCQAKVQLARSVMLRGNIFRQEGMISAWGKYPMSSNPKEQARRERIYEQYKRNTAYRRAFVCNACYLHLDSRSGLSWILTPTGPKIFGIAGTSRGGKAAVYTVVKWRQLQNRLWNRYQSESA